MALIFKNMFSREEIEEIFSVIKQEKQNRSYKNLLQESGTLIEFNEASFIGTDPGREMFELFPLPIKIIDKIKNSISKNQEYSYVGTAYCEYNLKHGNPFLPMHFDKNKNNVCFDYQLSSNTSWPITIKDKDYLLENNDAILFDPGYELHGRPEKTFNENEYINMFFIFWRKYEN
jgi:hypothetical protein